MAAVGQALEPGDQLVEGDLVVPRNGERLGEHLMRHRVDIKAEGVVGNMRLHHAPPSPAAGRRGDRPNACTTSARAAACTA